VRSNPAVRVARQAVCLILPALSAGACSEGDAGLKPERRTQAIVAGEVDPGDPGVVFVYDSARGRLCSGSLVGRNLVLTARHCVASASTVAGRPLDYVDCALSRFGANSDAHAMVIGNAPVTSSEGTVRGAEVLVPPGDDGECSSDVALIVLASDFPAPPLVPRIGSPVTVGESIRAVGYGATAASGVPGVGTKRSRGGLHVTCVGAGPPLASPTGSDWEAEGGACDGDSGGPALDGQGRVVGVASRAASDCSGPIYADVAAWSAFLRGGAAHAAAIGGGTVAEWARASAAEPVGGACRLTASNGDRTAWMVTCAALLALLVRRTPKGSVRAFASWRRANTGRRAPRATRTRR
jgi:hypothetical protein